MKAKKLKISFKGSFTVEASIIFSVVFLLTAAMVYAFIIIYQYAGLQSTANRAANIGSIYYVNKYQQEQYVQSGFNLYWRLIDTEAESKKNKLKNYLNENLTPSIFKTSQTVKIDTSYELILKQLNVSINEEFPLPAGNLFEVFGISPTIDLTAQATAPLDDNAEFVRNLDTVIDIKNCIFNTDNKWIGKDSKVNDILDKLLKKH